MRREPSVVLLSGGLDSAANLAFCTERDRPVLAVTADYGQRAFRSELRAARSLCKYYRIPHRVLDLRWLGGLGKSALTDRKRQVPKLSTAQLDTVRVTRRSAAAVWVPNRNGVLINAAAAMGEALAASRVVVGFNIEEAATFPDNSQAFIRQASGALAYSTANGIRVFSYTGAWDKRRIVKELQRLKKPFPFERVWSCYYSAKRPCGTCESCRRLARARGLGS